MLERARLFLHTASHLRPAQAVARARLRGGAAWRRLAPALAAASYRRDLERASLTRRARPFDPAATTLVACGAERAAALAGRYLSGEVEYLGVAARVGRPASWRSVPASQLWRYHLYYFDELPIAAQGGDPSDIVRLMREWVAAYPLGSDRDAWHPYVVSLRAVNWMRTAAALEERGEPVPDDVLDAMRLDALFVHSNLEEDVGGNHLLKNLKALAFASAFWDGPRAAEWRRWSLERWVREMDRQVLTDGGHYERSPMYHCQVLGDLLETISVLSVAGGVPDPLIDAARRMVAFLDIVCHPDGEIALFNDSTVGAAPAPSALRAFAAPLLGGAPPPSSQARELPARHSGFHRVESGDRHLVLIADMGEPCPPDLPAHAHADFGSFELSVDGRRVVVDSGVAEYAAGEWRDYWRSTRAHNTVTVDDVEQTECWGSFRVARRAHPANVCVVDAPPLHGVSGSHTGFRHLTPAVDHRRTVALVRDRWLLVVDDIAGTGTRRWASHLHFHPDVELRVEDGHATAAIGPSTLRVFWAGPVAARSVRGSLEPIQGWYAPAFGLRQPSSTLVLEGRGVLPARIAAVIAPGVGPGGSVAWEGDDVLMLNVGGETIRVGLPG